MLPPEPVTTAVYVPGVRLIKIAASLLPAASAVAPEALELLTSREESLGLLKLDGLVDLIIPRGSNELVRFIQDNTRIPVLGHADGICHLYVDREVDIPQAVRVAIDAKTQYPAACNAIETACCDAH